MDIFYFFELYSSEDNYRTVKETKTTSNTGIIDFTNLRVGYTYKIKEISTNQYYVLDSNEKTIAISNQNQQNLTITNNPKVAYIDVEKVDTDFQDNIHACVALLHRHT